MNLIRSILSASVLVAGGVISSGPMNADSPNPAPTRLAGGQLKTADNQFDHWFRSSFSHVQLVADEFTYDDEVDSLALMDEGDEQSQSDTRTNDDSANDDSVQSAGDLGNSDQAASDEDPTTEDEESKRRDRITAGIGALKKPVTEIRINTTPGGEVPENRAELFSQHGPAISIGALGIASASPDRYTICFTHRPLYYEQRNLERCGRGCGCLQNGVSAAQFLWNTALLPYQIGRQHCDCPVTAGGDCMTCQSYPIDCKLLPCDLHGVTVQAAALAGFTFLLL
jgi:hypothetical protein